MDPQGFPALFLESPKCSLAFFVLPSQDVPKAKSVSKFDSYVLISSASISSGLEILNQRKPCRTSGMKKVPSVVWSCLCLFFSHSASSAFTCSPTCTDSAFVKALTPLLPLSRPALIACVRVLGTSSTRSSHCQSCPAFIRLSSFHVVVSLGLYLPRGKIRIFVPPVLKELSVVPYCLQGNAAIPWLGQTLPHLFLQLLSRALSFGDPAHPSLNRLCSLRLMCSFSYLQMRCSGFSPVNACPFFNP